MPSSVSHAMAAVALAASFAPSSNWRRLALTGAVCAVVPDLDALPRVVGRPDFAFLGGHRGFTHSITFAALAGLSAGPIFAERLGVSRRWLFAFTAAATLSHGVLDAFSDFGGRVGVAFLSPFSSRRFNAEWQPVRGEFSELLWCLAPLMLLTAGAVRFRGLPHGIGSEEQPTRLGLK